MGAQPESKLSRAIMAALRNRGVWCFKVHGGPFTQAGTPDIIACVPVMVGEEGYETEQVVGIFVGFETKTPSGGDPSPVQGRQHDLIRAACGHVFVPRTVQDAVDAIESLGYTPAPEYRVEPG
jgi:hypothetical protein